MLPGGDLTQSGRIRDGFPEEVTFKLRPMCMRMGREQYCRQKEEQELKDRSQFTSITCEAPARLCSPAVFPQHTQRKRHCPAPCNRGACSWSEVTLQGSCHPKSCRDQYSHASMGQKGETATSLPPRPSIRGKSVPLLHPWGITPKRCQSSPSSHKMESCLLPLGITSSG